MAGTNKNVGEVMAKLSPEVEALIKRYEEAQINLVNIIATQESRGNLTTYRKGILEAVRQELKLLNEYSAKWANDNISKAYETGAEETYAAFRAKNIAVGKVALNEKVVNKLVDNTIGQLKDATDFVGRRIDDDIRKAGLEAIANKTATGSTVKEAKANLINRLTDKGITAIRDKRGREINLDAYASTVARTTTAEATNKAAIQTVEDLGYDLVKITQHFSSCPVCAVYEGRVYSISGKSKDYPPLDEAFKDGYSTIHPNCTHRAVPYFPQYDDNAEELKKASNKPFNVDDRSKASIEAYNRQQAIKTARRNDRNEWEQAKLVAPNETPKTFSGFRSMKKAETPKYQAIKLNLAAKPQLDNIRKSGKTKNIDSNGNEVFPTEHQQKYFKWGKELKEEVGDEYSYRSAMKEVSMRSEKWADRFEFIAESEDEPFFHTGFNEREPEWVQAVRFGEIPENGRSMNWATRELENGISTVGLIRNGKELEKGMYDVIYGIQDTQKYLIEGWYFGFTGSDGEPLLHFAKVVEKLK